MDNVHVLLSSSALISAAIASLQEGSFIFLGSGQQKELQGRHGEKEKNESNPCNEIEDKEYHA